MNDFRDNPDLEYLRNGTPEGDLAYFFKQWNKASEGSERDYRHHSSVSKNPSNPQIFATPYVEKYFEGILPDCLPENSKVERVMVVTDLDVKFWYSEHIDQRQGFSTYPDVYHDVVAELYNSDNSEESTQDCHELSGFIYNSLLFNMRHMPKAVFHHSESSTALIVLSAVSDADYHLKEMAGIGCLPEMGFDTGEIHDAMMRHEWFHLSDDRHLSDTQMEIAADKTALKGLITPSLKEAWVNARIVGGFMWPFPGRQNGLTLINDRFSKKANQEMQMNVVYDWCDHAVKEFYDEDTAMGLMFQIMEDHFDYISQVDEDIREFFNNKILEIRELGRPIFLPDLPPADNFKEWFQYDVDPKIADRAWKYFTQSYMMKLQVSNANNLGFYKAVHELSLSISPEEEEGQRISTAVHQAFRNSLEELLPDVRKNETSFQPQWRQVQLPGVKYPYNPYIGDQHEGALSTNANSFTVYTL